MMAEEQRHIIEPERIGLWVAVGFTLALIALATAFLSLYRVHAVLVGTQIEVLALNKRIVDLEKGQKTAAQAAQQDFVSRAPAVQKAYEGYSLQTQRQAMLALAESTGLEYAGKTKL